MPKNQDEIQSEAREAVSMGATARKATYLQGGIEVVVGFQLTGDSSIHAFALDRNDALLLARNIHDAIEDITTPS